jgi:hypothetical protein
MSSNHLDSKLVGVTQDHPLWWVSTTRNHQPGPIREGNRTQSPSYLFCSGTSPTVYDLLEGQATSDLQTTVVITTECNGCYRSDYANHEPRWGGDFTIYDDHLARHTPAVKHATPLVVSWSDHQDKTPPLRFASSDLKDRTPNIPMTS